MSKVDSISREEFDLAVEAVWSEIEYQNNMDNRTSDEAKDVPGFLTLGRRYMRSTEDAWADQRAVGTPPRVPMALDGIRKLAGIFIRAMVYSGIQHR